MPQSLQMLHHYQWHLAPFRDFFKKHRNPHGFAREYLRSCLGYGPSQSLKRRDKSCSLHSKIFLLGGCGFFVTDIISEVVLGSFWLMLPGLGPNY